MNADELNLKNLTHFYSFVLLCCEIHEAMVHAESGTWIWENHEEAKEQAHRMFIGLPEIMRESVRYLYDATMNGDF